MNKVIASAMATALLAAVIGCESPRPAPPPRYVPIVHPVSLADIKAMTKAGVSDEIILSQIRNARVEYHLSTAEILDLKDSGVSQKVIDFMINTPGLYQRSAGPRY